MKGYWAVPVVFGIALMLGLSSVPAVADRPDVVCSQIKTPDRDISFVCSKDLQIDDHVIIHPAQESTLCHVDVVSTPSDRSAFVEVSHIIIGSTCGEEGNVFFMTYILPEDRRR